MTAHPSTWTADELRAVHMLCVVKAIAFVEAGQRNAATRLLRLMLDLDRVLKRARR